MNPAIDPRPYVLLVGSIAAIGAAISSLEWICNRRQLMDDGLFSWQVTGSRPIAVGSGPVPRILNLLLSFRWFQGILVIRLVALLWLPVLLWLGHGVLVALLIIVGTSLLLNLRSPFGMDGSDQMSMQVFGALCLGFVAHSDLGLKASLWFIAAQACLSYFTSGAAKAFSSHWRRGDIVFAIFNTRTYGFEPVARFLYPRPVANKMATYGAMAMECAFPLVLIAGWPAALLFIAWGVAFHFMNAVVMGLNSFFWSFLSTYPAVIYTSLVVGSLVYARF
ncbi:MAG TPA: hypothetical protein VFI42_20885 [Thermomicrobiaceae bacterium]|nr:hypothetical protein [Thermomicrobiaceae bacterium]